jgi:hypothetical protein
VSSKGDIKNYLWVCQWGKEDKQRLTSKDLDCVSVRVASLTLSCEMSTHNFFIKFFGQHVHPRGELLRSGPKRDLCEDLIAEGARHDEGGMSSGTAAGSNEM